MVNRISMQQGSELLSRAQNVLRALTLAGFPEAQVSGGYLRDVVLLRQPKDMDVFIGPFSGKDTSRLEAELSRALGTQVLCQFDLSYGEDSEIHRVFQAMNLDGVPVQVIELATGFTPAGRFSSYDFALCQITMDATGEVRMTTAFSNDLVSATCTLVSAPTAKEYDRSMRRWERWAEDFKAMGIRLVAPPRPADALVLDPFA